MKKSTSLLFALISTLFLAVGAARAAEKFDTQAAKDLSINPGSVMDGPSMPCGVPDDN